MGLSLDGYHLIGIVVNLKHLPREQQTRGSIPVCAGIFLGQVKPVT